jgi:aminoglycoside phosphotransferase
MKDKTSLEQGAERLRWFLKNGLLVPAVAQTPAADRNACCRIEHQS